MAKEKYAYEIEPTNFVSLNSNKKVEKISGFHAFLDSLACDATLHVVKSSKVVEAGDQVYEPNYLRFFAESDGEPIDPSLDEARFVYQRTLGVPRPPEIVKSFMWKKYVALEGGVTATTATVTALPDRLTEGFLAELYAKNAIDRITIRIKPVPQDIAVSKIRTMANVETALVLQDLERAKTPKADIQRRAADARELAERLAGEVRLFGMTVNFTVMGKDKEEREGKLKRLKAACAAKLIKLDIPRVVQDDMLTNGFGKGLYVSTDTLGCLYPFASADIIESPGGVFLGINRMTNAPVIYDLFTKKNQNLVVIAKTGAGKSYFVKILTTRLASSRADICLYIIDPDNEYRAVGGELGAQVVDVTRSKKLGLDPLVLFADSKDIATHMIADLTGVAESDDPEIKSELKIKAARCRTLAQLYRKATKELKKYLKGLVKGPERFLFEGKPLKFGRRMVFNLRELHRALQMGKVTEGALHIASLLILSKVWNEIDKLPPAVPKIVVVDEAWLYLALPAAAKFMEEVSRRGRKRNVIFVPVTQLPADVLRTKEGQTVVANCATKVLLGQDETTIDLVRDSFKLTGDETEALLGFKPGQALFMTEDTKIGVNFVATDREHKLFTTKPSEVM